MGCWWYVKEEARQRCCCRSVRGCETRWWERMWVVNVSRFNRQADSVRRKGEVGGDFRLPLTNISS